MKKVLLVLVLAVLFCFAGTIANAGPFMAFEQDNFTLTFTGGSAGAAGNNIVVTGDLKAWNANTILYNFVLTGSNTSGAQLQGNYYFTNYNNSTLTIYAATSTFPTGAYGAQVWTGNGFVTTNVYDVLNSAGDPTITFLASNYSRPNYVTQPSAYESMGTGLFTGAAGQTIPDVALVIPWLGTYNWGYGPNYQFGNTQGEITVPEPISLLLLGFGLIGLAGIRRKFNKG
jgi:hypothetical protein